MGKGINTLIIVGRLTRDPDMKYLPSGTAVCNFSLACNDIRKNGDKYDDEVSFFNCAAFGKRAETMNQYLAKGKRIGITGKLKQNRWTQDGQNRSRVEIIVNEFQFLDNPKESSGNNDAEFQATDTEFDEDAAF